MSTPTNRKESSAASSPALVKSDDTNATSSDPTNGTDTNGSPMKDGSSKEIKGQQEVLATASTQLLNVSNQISSVATTISNQILNKFDQLLQKLSPLLQQWKGRRNFLIAQGQVSVVLLVAYVVNNWPVAYPREDNHSDFMFWFMTFAMGCVAYATTKHKKSERGVQLLSRAQTEEWKGWMQFIFIMYHYYRNRAIYNEIRVLVSAYVWMTGFGHFLYCDKKQDFSLERMVSMWVRINYFPLLLSVCLNVPLELYYVVPLHTVGFFMALATCYLAKQLRQKFPQYCSDQYKANAAAIAISFVIHALFFETSLHVPVLGMLSKEYVFRFSTDKYSAWFGVLCGFMWNGFQGYMQWCYGEEDSIIPSPTAITTTTTTNDNNNNNSSTEPVNGDTATSAATSAAKGKTSKPQNPKKIQAMYVQRALGIYLIGLWYFAYGRASDKHKYNPVHPYVFWMPVAGWLMLRNSSKYLTELHSTALEFIGRITLETYVLQFHVFMCRNVQYIPVIIPGSGVNGFALLKFVNMLVTGTAFVALSWYARRATVTTQNSITELVSDIRKRYFNAAAGIGSASAGTSAGAGVEENGLMKTKPTLGIIEDPEEVTPLKPTTDKKKDEEG